MNENDSNFIFQYFTPSTQKGNISNLIPEARVIKPLQQLFAHFHWARKESPIGQQEIFDERWIYDRVLLHQMHG